LIAEEVARVYPELVDYDHDGKPLTVRYLELNAMLLNELQKQAEQLLTQNRETRELTQRLESKDRQLAAQQREIDGLKQQNASIKALSQRLAVLERQTQIANTMRRDSLARN
jgi:hypothetical protein